MKFIKIINQHIIFSFLLFFSLNAFSQQASTNIPIPTQTQIAWQEAELTGVFHYDLGVFDNQKYNQAQNRITPIPDINIFNPTRLDTDQWIRSLKDMGGKIAILTATHETGFALYQSDVNPYCLKAVKWRDGKGDIVRDFVNSCRKYDILPAIYIGIRWNSFMGVYDFMVQGNKDQFQKNRQAFYNKMCEGMVEELMSRYGELALVWFDGGAHGPEVGGPDILGIVEKYQKNIIFYHNTQRADMRWGGSESGTVPYPCWGTFPFPYSHSKNPEVVYKNDFELLKRGDPDGKYYMPAMSDAPLRGYNGRHEWFWEPGDEAHIFPLENLMNMYYKSIGHNSTLILGLTPDPDGLLPEPDVKRLKEFGDEIKRRFGKPLASTHGQGYKISLNLTESMPIDHVVIQEDIVKGERVREYIIEGKVSGKWIKLSSGTCIGHKKIDRFETVKVSALRLVVKNAIANPSIKELSVFHVN